MTSSRTHQSIRANAFTLIESIICVVVLGLAVPPSLELLTSVAADRADAVNTERAVSFAQSLLESVLADVASGHEDLGFQALENTSAFEASFRSRTESLSAAYEDHGLSYALAIGPLVDRSGVVSVETSENIFRSLTITVTIPSAR
ncbi:MAG: hypothetical protein AAGA55_12975, partial [Planctomycetota bacterium]